MKLNIYLFFLGLLDAALYMLDSTFVEILEYTLFKVASTIRSKTYKQISNIAIPVAPFGQTLWFTEMQLFDSGSNDFPSRQIQFG